MVDNKFIDSSLSTNEKRRYNSIKFDKKRTEWLAGRIAAKFSLAYTHGKPLSQIEILKDENRSPYYIFDGVKTHVSITHSEGMALSTVRDKTVDLELISERSPTFVDEVFSPEEIKNYDLHNAESRVITMLWTMKEAHLKRMRIGLKTDLHGVIIKDLQDLDMQHFNSIVVSPQGKSKSESFIGSKYVITISSNDY